VFCLIFIVFVASNLATYLYINIFVFRPFYITLFKHLTFLGGRACCRTSLEFCKVLLSLDPQGDPLAIKLSMDFYALRAKEYQWLVDLVEELEAFNLMQLPNFSYSVAVACFYLGESGKADQFLQVSVFFSLRLSKTLF